LNRSKPMALRCPIRFKERIFKVNIQATWPENRVQTRSKVIHLMKEWSREWTALHTT
jgi:hypothetical protein